MSSAAGLNPQTAAVEISGVSFAYNGQEVLSQVNLRLEQKEFAALVGPNGGGKTTLLKLILGLLSPRQGQIKVLGADAAASRGLLGYVPQEARVDLHFPLTVLDLALMGCLSSAPVWGRFNNSQKQTALTALEQVNLNSLSHKSLADLSGGQRQRAFIARALAARPSILILDEPTSSLDPAVQQEIFDLLARLNQTMTIILASHDLSFVSAYVNKVVCVSHKVMLHDTCELDEDLALSLYGHPVRLVRHDHACGGCDLP